MARLQVVPNFGQRQAGKKNTRTRMFESRVCAWIFPHVCLLPKSGTIRYQMAHLDEEGTLSPVVQNPLS